MTLRKPGLKLWHDDVRPAPEGWLWARTNEQAKFALRGGKIKEISLDHDLGYHGVEMPDDPDELLVILEKHKPVNPDTGLQLVHWMIEEDLVPKRIRIHSWNPPGAAAMSAALMRAGHTVEVRPFNPDERSAPE